MPSERLGISFEGLNSSPAQFPSKLQSFKVVRKQWLNACFMMISKYEYIMHRCQRC